MQNTEKLITFIETPIFENGCDLALSILVAAYFTDQSSHQNPDFFLLLENPQTSSNLDVFLLPNIISSISRVRLFTGLEEVSDFVDIADPAAVPITPPVAPIAEVPPVMPNPPTTFAPPPNLANAALV